MKKYILIAGVNGAGKSTLYQSLQSLHDMTRVNTDECNSHETYKWVETSRRGKIVFKLDK